MIWICALGLASVRAGDILRPNSGGNLPAGYAGGATTVPPATVPTAATAGDMLARTTMALQAVQAMQAAARALSQTAPASLGPDPNHPGQTLPNVPDGLASGGLQVESGGVWQGANAPTESASGGQTTVTVTQTSEQAVLTWQTFNIGRNTTLAFDQSAGDGNESEWIAFNKVDDPSGTPSQILGAIQAGGQVYVINPNGIIFGGSSQVNVHTLVASSLPINDNLIASGLLNNPDDQFLFTSVAQPAGVNGTPAFTPAAASTPTGADGAVTVQPGATLLSPVSADNVGGRIALIGPAVTNGGTISTPSGQAILAAGQEVGMAAHSSSDPSLRGLDVYVGQGGGAATNAAGADIEAPEGDVMMVGAAVNQLGAINSSTSVSYNGRIDLLADYNSTTAAGVAGLPPFFPQSTGVVTLGPGSLTQILPEWASADTYVGSTLALPSQINLQGLAVYFAPNALLYAPNANVTAGAGTWSFTGSGETAQDQFVYTAGQIYLDSGATLDVSGSADISAPISQNIIAIQLLGTELANSPLQRDGPLFGQTIYVDIRQTGTYDGTPWVGTPLADTSGYVGLIQRTVGEMTIGGGTVSFKAGSSVVVQPGATVNVSGGWISYQGGTVETSEVVTTSGQVLNIAEATPDQTYTGLYTATTSATDAKWGTTLVTSNPQLDEGYEAGYIQGGSGGAVSITAPSVALDGNFLGTSVSGPYQRASATPPSSFSLVIQGQDPALAANDYPAYSPTPPAIVFSPTSALPAAGPFGLDSTGNPLPLPAARQSEAVLPPSLVDENGFGRLTVQDSDGPITIPSGVALKAVPGGSISLTGSNIDLEGTLAAPGGSLTLAALDVSPYANRALSGGETPVSPPYDPNRGNFTLGPSASLSAAGLLVDDGPNSPDPESLPLLTSGGSVSIKASNVALAAGSTIDVSGGADVSPADKVAYGNGGAITIAAGQDVNVSSVLGGSLTLGGALLGFSGEKGASLSLLAPEIQVGGAAATGGTLLLSPSFFDQGGFDAFSLTGLGAQGAGAGQYLPGVLISPGIALDPVSENWLAIPNSVPGEGDYVLDPALLPQGLRQSVSLSFDAAGVRNPYNSANPIVVRGDLVLGAGASIATDPGGSVSLAGDTVAVLGSVAAPGGSISISGGKDSSLLFGVTTEALATVDLGPASSLSAAGATVLTPNARGYRTGTVLSGGAIAVSGNIVAEAGARLDVSGAEDVLDLLPTSAGSAGAENGSTSGSVLVPTVVASNGGSITLAGAQELLSDATLVGRAGGSAAVGGGVTVSSGLFYPVGTNANSQTPLDVTLTVPQNGPILPSSFPPAGATAIGQAVPGVASGEGAGGGRIAAAALDDGRFNSVTLAGTVAFTGPVSIASTGSLSVGSGGVIYADSPVSLGAPYVDLGSAFETPLAPLQPANAFSVQSQPFYFEPVYGPGSLNVSATLIDVGDLSLQGIGQANLTAAGGDIRGDGTLDIAGSLNLTAGQIYPPTAVTFTLAAYDYTAGGGSHPGSITIAGSGARPLPLSAAGVLNVFATDVVQGGTLAAPFGTINLGNAAGSGLADAITGKTFPPTQQLTLGPGSITSVSGVDPTTGTALTVPYGLNLNGTSWIDPSGTDITAVGPPVKAVNVSAATITDQAGAVIDLEGGGDLYAYRFVPGIGGENDVLASTGVFAVIPGYQAPYAPYGAYNSAPLTANLGSDPGYVNSRLSVGEEVYLGASPGLAAGVYTLLPARYALLPGAFLITPQSGAPPSGAAPQPDGSTVVAGYVLDGLDSAQTGRPLFASFNVASSAVFRAEAEYDDSGANAFFSQPSAGGASVPRLPVDSGQLVLAATGGMSLEGMVEAQAPAGGLGGLVDISSPSNILIAGSGIPAPAGTLVLDPASLSSFGSESLLIGGTRQTGANGTEVAVSTGNLTVDNPGDPLTGSDIILVANDAITLTSGSEISQTGSAPGPAQSLNLGNSSSPGKGDGVLLRVSGDPSATVNRQGVDASAAPVLTIGAGSELSGAAVTLDSTGGTNLAPNALLKGAALSIGSGQISLVLDPSAAAPSGSGLVLSGSALAGLESAQSLSLLSYSSIDIYGAGQIGGTNSSGQPELGSLALHAAEIRGFDQGSGGVAIAAATLLLDNSSGAAAPGPSAPAAGTLALEGNTVELGANALAIDQFSSVSIEGTDGILAEGSGSLSVQGALNLSAPVITAGAAANEAVSAGGALALGSVPPGGGAAPVAGLDATLTLAGASLTDNGVISLPGGSLTLHATTGDVSVGTTGQGVVDLAGTAAAIYDQITYGNGGALTLQADRGSVVLGAGASITVAAPSGGGNAGSISVSAPEGTLGLGGALSGQGGSGGAAGSFSADLGSIPGGETGPIDAFLNSAGFTLSRTIRVRTGDVTVDGTATASTYDLSADTGSIEIAGTIDASGTTGGTIGLEAAGSVTLAPGSLLTVAGQNFNDAGQGGSVTIEAGDEVNGNHSGSAAIDIQSGATINLSVAAETTASAALGDLSGTLHLRAPQNAAGTDLQIDPIQGNILGASSIEIEGYETFNLAGTGGAITSAVESAVFANGSAFAANSAAIENRLLGPVGGAGGPIGSIAEVVPGAEIINPNGDLTLDTAWDLSTYRFGPGNNLPGDLTLRASGNLVFGYSPASGGSPATFGSLSDGFGGSSTYGLWDAPLLPAGSQSWSYRLTAGADFSAADYTAVLPLSALGPTSGSLLLGANSPSLPVPSNPNSPNNLTSQRQNIIPNFYETIRTGTGSIDISAGRDVLLLNPIATIYTAGTQAAAMANFQVPQLSTLVKNSQLGAVQSPVYPAQYSLEGGDVTIAAQEDIAHDLEQGSLSDLVPDSSKELPDNWLYRRGAVNPATGQFAAVGPNGEIESTSWWIDFSNFFEGVGALGGGNVRLVAGRNIENVDAVVPTNARMPEGTPNASALVELGGGDLLVQAGGDIDGGVYYVERGQGSLVAGGSILTNPTRAALSEFQVVAIEDANAVPDPSTWLPTTLFLGDGDFSVTAGQNLLLGPVANPFLLPQGVNNNAYDKTYFSTYAPGDSVTATALTGTLTLRDATTDGTGTLAGWEEGVLLYDPAHHETDASYSEPWLEDLETNNVPFLTVEALMPPTLKAAALSGDIDVVGSLLLSPAPSGNLTLAAAGSINGMDINAYDSSTANHIWDSASINVSDADPARVPGVAAPLSLSAADAATPSVTPIDLMTAVNALFAESGSTEGTYSLSATKEELHAPGPLHAGDPNPVELYAGDGSISGVTLFSPKETRVIAGQDITDVAFYLQNDNPGDVSVVDAGRDLIAYDPDSPLRVEAQSSGNELAVTGTLTPEPASGNPTAGDISIGGPGTLEVLAGRNLTLGVGPNAGDGTAVGITSIGNTANPYLPFAGANVIGGAGIGAAAGLDASRIDFAAFIAAFLNPATAGANAAIYLPDLGPLLGLAGAGNDRIWGAFSGLPAEEQDRLALDVFYLVLRDAGRNRGDPASPDYGTYDGGYSAIQALFPGSAWSGDISLTSREVKTESGGDITLFAPGGDLTVGVDLAGNQPVDQGILTADGGNISIFTQGSVNVGTSRIFTLRGGNEVIWSSEGNIAAGASSKTVQSAPPTRVLIDPQSADVKTDLAGLATGGGIGVLETVVGVPAGDVDLIAPAGTVDAGQAGIRVSGNLTISALKVVNATNIQVGGTSAGVPAVVAPSLGGLAGAAGSATAASANAAAEVAAKQQEQAGQVPTELPSLITVEVLGYGGGD